MDFRVKSAAAVALAGVLAVGTAGVASTSHRTQDDSRRFAASLVGYEEVPAVSTRARGSFRATLVDGGIAWRLRYAGIEGGAVQQAHIHFGQRAVAGGVSAFLCGGLPTPPAGVQPCPADSATLRGTIRAQDVIGPAGQGIAAGELGELVRAMNAGVAYVNVHSARFPTGEVRGQIGRRR